MKICVVGCGYVGLVTGACLSKLGHTVVCVDRNKERIYELKMGVCPIYEPGLPEILNTSTELGTLSFTSDIRTAALGARAIIVAVGTPTMNDGSSDTSAVLESVTRLAELAEHDAVIIIKSTVPVGTNRVVRRLVESTRPTANLTVGSNPEFLREGSAVKDFNEPDRIVIGFGDRVAGEVMREIYRPLIDNGAHLIQTSCENAEIIKYAANGFLALKVTFANELSDLCEVAGGNMEEVANALGFDSRIGSKYLIPGPGYGGSCFPKDTRALAHIGQNFGARQTLIEAVIARNEVRKEQIAQRILTSLGRNVRGKSVCIWGVAFKANTDDIREAPAVTIIQRLEDAGVKVRAHDPKAMEHARRVLPVTKFFTDPEEAASGVDVVAVLTEWPIYRDIDFKIVAEVMNGNLILDFRNFLPRTSVTFAGLRLATIGNGADQRALFASEDPRVLVNGTQLSENSNAIQRLL